MADADPVQELEREIVPSQMGEWWEGPQRERGPQGFLLSNFPISLPAAAGQAPANRHSFHRQCFKLAPLVFDRPIVSCADEIAQPAKGASQNWGLDADSAAASFSRETPYGARRGNAHGISFF